MDCPKLLEDCPEDEDADALDDGQCSEIVWQQGVKIK